VAGRVALSRAVLGWLGGVPYVVVDRDGAWWDAPRKAEAVYRSDVASLGDTTAATAAEPGWLDSWLQPAKAVAAAVDAVLDETDVLTEPRVARDVAAGLPDGAALVVASSMPIRDLDLTMRPRSGLRVVANRGVSGIDGFVSTAFGVAVAHPGPTWALAGDLSLLHDVNGFVARDRPDLTFAVVNNDGGGIFSLLPQADADGSDFELLFGTPHGLDVAKLAAAYGVEHTEARTGADLAGLLGSPARGVRLVEVRTRRDANAALHERLRAAAAAALA
jgi:2-succinyl-5-enolpyruvyl-6-hydroxy-3-cyclohexene-1-carboxylate synthase